MNFDFGDIPTWVAAIGALAAAAFALGQLNALRRQARLQQRQLDSQADGLDRLRETQRKQGELLDLEIRDRRAAQARSIQVQRLVVPWQDPGSGVMDAFAQVLRITNNSHGAISNVDGYFMLAGSRRRSTVSVRPEATERPPGWAAQIVPGGNPEIGVVPVARLEVNQTIDLIGPMYSEDKAKDTEAELFFMDSDARRWRVDYLGQLTEVVEGLQSLGAN